MAWRSVDFPLKRSHRKDRMVRQLTNKVETTTGGNAHLPEGPMTANILPGLAIPRMLPSNITRSGLPFFCFNTIPTSSNPTSTDCKNPECNCSGVSHTRSSALVNSENLFVSIKQHADEGNNTHERLLQRQLRMHGEEGVGGQEQI